MKVEQLTVGQLATNCYLIWDEETLEGAIIDPGDDGEFIIQKIQNIGISPKSILVTHGHFDHIGAVTELRLAFNIPFYLHQKDLFLIKRATRSARFFTGVTTDPCLPPDKFLKEGEIIKIGQEELKVLETPGHTPGSVSFFAPKILFSGDVIFEEGVGRVDFSYSSKNDLRNSIKKILSLPPETLIFPGHGETFKMDKIKIKEFY